MIDVMVEALSSYRKAGSPKSLFEIACLKMCELNDNVVEKVVYKEVVKEEITNNKPIDNLIKEEPVTSVKETVMEVKQETISETPDASQESTNVSHETPVTIETPKEEPKATVPEISEQELLNVLVQASKDALMKAKQQWVMLPKYLNNPTTAKVAGLLLDGYPVAACDNVVMIGYNNDVYLNRVYAEGNYDEMNNFLKALYNGDVKCYCLTLESFTSLKEKYMTLRQLGKLPKPVPIVIQRRSVVEKQEDNGANENLEYAKKLFGDNLVIEGE